MEAVVTIKLTPTELDVLRNAVDAYVTAQQKLVVDMTIGDPAVRLVARQQAVLASDLGRSLR